uniref:DNA mismatch repair protein MutL n=1 Tax=candidate division WOR-3 bacterium TaxID=2052148 RepID=A0A7C3J5C5_UNCW3
MKIKLLPESVYSFIAAGEVIDRPASVVRELIQNSIDAKASSITVSINRGGKELINIIDDGEGMDRDDLLFATKKHATSKINTLDDLKNIITYGFRGEALYSVGLVSHLTIESKVKEDDLGNSIIIDCGEVKGTERSSIEKGTSIVVKDLFKNIPARKKFLKSDLYEQKKVEDEFVFHSIANPEISFKFIVDGHIVYNLKSSDLRERIKELKGENFIKETFFLDYFERGIRIKGFVGNPKLFNNIKYKFSMVFVNKRYINYPQIKKAIFSAFGTQLKRGFTPYIIFIDISPHLVDFNVHPMKKEVKFSSENDLFFVVNRSVKSGLAVDRNFVENDRTLEPVDLSKPDFFVREEKLFSDVDFYLSEKKTTNISFESSKFWQFQNSYIFVSVKDKLYILDQHAAAERISYEKLLKEKEKITSQKLLFPFTLRLNSDIYIFVNENIEKFEKLGFSVRVFDNNKILVESVPSIIEDDFNKEDFEEFVNEIYNLGFGSEFDEILKIVACKSSIKAGKKLNSVEMEEIFNQLFKCENPHACPHGRPTFITFSIDDFEKWFRRR